MRPQIRQAGVGILQVLLGVALSGLFTVLAISAVVDRLQRAELNEAVQSAIAIANVADSAAQQVTASAPDAAGVFQYTYGQRRAAWATVDLLNADFGTALPLETPYETEYEYINDGHPAVVRFTIPPDEANELTFVDGGTYTVAIDGGGQATVTVQVLRRPGKLELGRLRYKKRALYLEDRQ